LKAYAKARLVVTSRIHCAFPCISFNTPVVFLVNKAKTFDEKRLSGIKRLLNCIEIDGKNDIYKNTLLYAKNVLELKNLDKPEQIINNLQNTVNSFIKE
jgi:hypothetical protein